MANVITGMSDIVANTSAGSIAPKSILIVGEIKPGSGEIITTSRESIFPITSVVDAVSKFGTDSVIGEMTRLMIVNGATDIRGIAVGEYGDGKTYTDIASAYKASFDKSLSDGTIGFIMCDTVDATVITKLSEHLTYAESEDKLRYSITGCVDTSSANLSTVASGINNSRIIIYGPSLVDSSNNVLNPVYGASALTAIAVNEAMKDPALPMNNIKLIGFGGVDRTINKVERDTLVNAGITPIVMLDGKPTIYRLTTTCTTIDGTLSKAWLDATTRFIADNILESVINRLRANYPRTKNVVRVLNSIKTDIIDVLSSKQDFEIIKDFDKSMVSVKQDPNNIYGAIVEYTINVVTPLYVISIKQHVSI